MSDLEYRMRVAKKIDEVLKAEFADPATQTFDALEAAHVLGLSFGLGLAAAPDELAQQNARYAHERGIRQAIELRAALELMGVGPDGQSS